VGKGLDEILEAFPVLDIQKFIGVEEEDPVSPVPEGAAGKAIGYLLLVTGSIPKVEKFDPIAVIRELLEYQPSTVGRLMIDDRDSVEQRRGMRQKDGQNIRLITNHRDQVDFASFISHRGNAFNALEIEALE
jgi:hypothetical protein